MRNKLLYLPILLLISQWTTARPRHTAVHIDREANNLKESSNSTARKIRRINSTVQDTPLPRTNPVTWADPEGFLWVFGGIGNDENNKFGCFGDLWKYYPMADKWELIKGEPNKVTSDAKKPSAAPVGRRDSASWVDQNGNLWMFGGRTAGDLFHLDDMWIFELSGNKWVQVTGSGETNVKPDYGTSKQYSKTSSPGSRSNSATWTDNDGNFWLFGGVSGSENTVIEIYNDLWMFNAEKRQWRKMGGSETTNQLNGIKNELDSGDEIFPSSRHGASAWYDQKNNELWLYGGLGFGETKGQTGALSDLWKFEIESGKWILKNRPSGVNKEPVVSSWASFSKENNPGKRNGTTHWVDGKGNILLMGGHYTFSQEETFIDSFLWKYDLEKEMWNVSTGLDTDFTSNGTVFKDQQGTFYLFGGKRIDPQTKESYPVNSVKKLKD